MNSSDYVYREASEICDRLIQLSKVEQVPGTAGILPALDPVATSGGQDARGPRK